jgi:PilZ domain
MLPKRGRESRKSQRRWTRRSAEAVFGANKKSIPCAIIDISSGGARLGIAHPSAILPRTFTLVLFEDGSLQRDCEVMWTDGRQAGVKFVSEWYAATRVGRVSTPVSAPRMRHLADTR